MLNTELTGSLIPLNQAIREVIPGEKNPSTVHRWITRGLAGVDGKRIRLQVWYAGRQPCTTKKAIREFLDSVTDARLQRMKQAAQQSPEVSDAELAAAGLLSNRRMHRQHRAR
jgi:hypothetical protein